MEDNNYDIIKTERFLTFRDKDFYWPEDIRITLEDIQQAIDNNIETVNEMYDDFAWFNGNFKSKEWHLGRIIHFIKHPEKINAIKIDNKCENYKILPIPFIEDGNHRFMAVLYLKWDEFKAEYSGRKDVLEYLQGERDTVPY